MNHIQWVKSPKIFINRSGQAGGGDPPSQSGQPDRFFTFFLPLPLTTYQKMFSPQKCRLKRAFLEHRESGEEAEG